MDELIWFLIGFVVASLIMFYWPEKVLLLRDFALAFTTKMEKKVDA